MNYWWIVASQRDSDHGWHWDYFFENPYEDGDEYDWGGADWIRSSSSHARITEMQKGDIVVAYQAQEGILGLIYLANSGYSSLSNEIYDSFKLKPKPAIYLDNPIPYSSIRDLLQSDKHFEFVNFHQGTVFRISRDGFEMLLSLILNENKKQEKAIRKFLTWGGLQELYLVASDHIAASSALEPPKRVHIQTTRIIRDTTKTKKLKKRYGYRCQLCSDRISISPNRFYAEVHHIRPLGGSHMGLDDESNMIVVCPTHHAYFDLGVPKFSSEKEVIIGNKIFRLTLKHELSYENLKYHNTEIFGRNA
jgi:hypothetical protein